MRRWVPLVAVLATVGCGTTSAPPTTSPTPTPSPTKVTPTNLPQSAPQAPPATKKPTDASAVRFAKYVVETFYFALTTRDEGPLTDLVVKPRKCRGCQDTAAAIEDLKQQEIYQVPGQIKFGRTALTGREDPRVIVTSAVRVRPGTWVSETDGATGVLARQRPEFTLLLTWDKQTSTWRLVDYTVTT